ncbi:DEAD/DEAH box helicase family protein [Candidatus Pelagibacter sp.]|nr:DEAD/DEAH box helicase family protein [Candidatus Pelagibacter sp.]
MKERKIIQSSKSWKDLDRTIKKLIKNKQTTLAGSIFEHLTKLYLEVSPEYKTKLSKVYLLNEVPNSLKKKLNLPNTDEGIDLIAETFDKEYWAIQCKFRSDKTETLKVKGDLATFNNLAFTICKNISHGIVCATVNRPPKKEHLLNVGYILLKDWLGLDRDNGELFKQIKNKAIGKITKPKKLNPRPHQKNAITKTLSYFKNNERGKMIMPCGTGKSLTAFWIAEKMKSKSILVAVPSLALLQQTLKVWTREFLLHNIQPDWLCVCSDDTVKEEQDDFVTFSADLGIKVDTNPRIIKKFLSKKTDKIKIVFTTYQSGRATAIGSKGYTYDLGIMDEAHKTVGSKTKEMAHLLHQKNVKIKKRLFMTATERLFRGDSDEFMSMDDPRDYGNLIYELSFKEAINSKPPIISDYKIITFGISNPEIETITQDNKYLEVKKDLKDITARELAIGIALRKAIKKLNIKNAISFHRSIKRADNFRKQQDLITKIYPTYGKLKTFHVRGDMPTSDRALEMLSFEEQQGLMTNARCLTEGVDLPAIDCVCFTDPKRSKVDIVQAAGRALRLSKGKKFGYILIPIFIPDGMDFNTSAEQQGFDEVSTTVRALATTDKRIVEYLRAISEGKTPPIGGSPVDGKVSIHNLYKVEAEDFNKAIQLKIWDKVAIGNYKSYEEAKAFAKKNNIKFERQWRELNRNNKLPKDIPYSVEMVYKSDWINWPSFLNTKNRSRYINFQSYEKASVFAKSLKISSAMQWRKNSKSEKFPINIPVNPDNYYKNWKGWGDFLGTKNTATRHKNYKSYSYAKKFARKFNFKNQKEWYKHTKSKNFPPEIPKIVDKVYQKKKQWIDWGDFLGTKFVSLQHRKYRSFDEAKKYVLSKNIRTYRDWNKHTKSKNFPKDIPVALRTYKEWVSAIDFFGPRPPRETNYRSFEKAKKYAKQKEINTKENWFEHTKSKNFPKDIPVAVSSTNQYKSQWKGWPDFLGKKK